MAEQDLPVCSVVLFGSRARGDAEPDSDYDVLVVLERVDIAIRDAVNHCAWEAGFDECLVIVPVPVTRHDVELGPMKSSLLMKAAREEGVAI